MQLNPQEEPEAVQVPASSARSSLRSDACSDMGSLASDGSQLVWPSSAEVEHVEQPNASRKVKVTVCEAGPRCQLYMSYEGLKEIQLNTFEDEKKHNSKQ